METTESRSAGSVSGFSGNLDSSTPSYASLRRRWVLPPAARDAAANRCGNVTRGLSHQDTADFYTFRGGPGKRPTRRPHEGRKPKAPFEDPSLRQRLYRRRQPRSRRCR